MEMQYVGILVNSSLYKRIPSGRTGHEAIRYYEDAGRIYGLIPCYFRLQDILLRQNAVRAYIKYQTRYVRKRIDIPKVIHNRALYSNSIAKKKIVQLTQSGKQVFNGWNRYGKLHIHHLLMANSTLRSHLPGTVTATRESLNHMIANYDSLILKPNSSSIGRGVMMLERAQAGWKLTFRAHGSWKTTQFTDKLPSFLLRKLRREHYIVQQRLPLATYLGRPFDLRVTVQRTITGGWKMAGIAGKVAARNAFITNVARGGTVYRLEEILQQYPELNLVQVRSDIESFCLRAAEHLSGHLPHLADVGFDIGLTASGYPMFIECNGRDLRYSFQKGNMLTEWKETYANPIGYARFLLEENNS